MDFHLLLTWQFGGWKEPGESHPNSPLEDRVFERVGIPAEMTCLVRGGFGVRTQDC